MASWSAPHRYSDHAGKSLAMPPRAWCDGVAAERRKTVAPGASPGYTSSEMPSPGGAKDFRGIPIIFRPSGADTLTIIYPPGLRPGLQSYAAPRLERSL